MTSLYKSAKGKKEILRLYDEKLKDLNINYRSIYVDTSYGRTHVLVTGESTNPPLVIVHGSNACAPIALECYPRLSLNYQVFAIDVLAQPNKSDETRLSMKDDSYGVWMNEVLTKLEITKVTMVGFSFGGLIILKTLIQNARKIKEAFLASPAYIVNGNPLIALIKIFIPMNLYMWTKNLKYAEKFLSVVFTERDEFAIRFLSKAFMYFKMDFTPVPTITQNEAQRIKTPITLIAAKNDIMFPGIKMINRAKEIFPSLKENLLLEQSKHVQSKEGNKIVENIILKNSSHNQ